MYIAKKLCQFDKIIIIWSSPEIKYKVKFWKTKIQSRRSVYYSALLIIIYRQQLTASKEISGS